MTVRQALDFCRMIIDRSRLAVDIESGGECLLSCQYSVFCFKNRSQFTSFIAFVINNTSKMLNK